ncbi:MAG TPA: mechanosensitive ion channel family protein [Thermoanaerobaculia bacterium]|nr:mechanosensitive ion channel family protein [Thermoanaerobaculia bacterium]
MQPEAVREIVEAVPEVPVPSPPPSLEAATGLILDKLRGWGEAAISNLPNLLVALLVVLAFWLLGRGVRSLVRRALLRTRMPTPIAGLIAVMVGFTILLTGFFIALGVIGLDRTVLALLGGVGIAGLALGFAFQDIVANFVSGILLSVRRPLDVGDYVETHGHEGYVDEINLRATVVRTTDGKIVHIPNKHVFENPIVNFSTLGRRRIDLPVGISYGDDLQRAKRAILDCLGEHQGVLESQPVEVHFTGYGASSIDLVVRFWVDFRRQVDFVAARGEAVERITQAFRDAGITIPFPIRTLDFGIVGGTRLDQMSLGVRRLGKGDTDSSSP